MSARKSARLVLEILGDERAPAELPGSGKLVLGSSAARADLTLEGQGVDEVHCAIGRTKAGGWALKDLGSQYGTIVNGERVTSARLRAGDQITIGSRRLRVVDPGAPPSPAAVAAAPAPPAAARPAEPAADDSGKVPAVLGGTAYRGRLPEIPGYRFEKRLGRGAMGDVFLALQESLDRRVAIKVLPSRLAAEAGFVRRFQAEARAAAALHHQNVVTVHDVGESDGLHFLSMEYMDRGSLEERVLNEGPLHWRQVLDILHDAASGLVYAESRGIVHRDIKPANLMQNHAGATKIADLGLATHIEEQVAAENGGGERRIVGTPHFISPEQVRGGSADCRSDLYSLGATAYRLLSGHTPFEGASTREILRAKMLEDPRPIRDLAPDLPPGVEAIVARLMEREPDRRYPTASALLADVDRERAGARGTAELPAGTPRASAGRPLKAAVGLVVLAVGAIAAVKLLGGTDGAAVPGPAGGQPEAGAAGRPGAAGAGGASDPSGGQDPGGPHGAGPPRDDDAQEKLFETRAQLAYERLRQNALAPEERAARLRELAREFDGTDAAARALVDADGIDEELRASEREERQRTALVGGMTAALRAAAGLDTRPIRPGDSLRRMLAVEGQEALADDDAFRAARAQIENEVVALALAQIDASLRAADEAGLAGDFARMREILVDVNGRTDMPELAPERTPAGAERLLEIRATVRARLDALDGEKSRFYQERSIKDALDLARGLGGPSGLEAELLRLDLAAAKARLDQQGDSLAVEANRAWARALAAEVELAAGALEFIAAEYPNWRRTYVSDPRARHGATRVARAASSQGLLLEVDGGATETVPWAAFGGNTRALDFLFNERLPRQYSREESRAIAALMKLTAVVDAVSQAAEMLAPGSAAAFTVREADELKETLALAGAWAGRAELGPELAPEMEAGALLAETLRQASQGSWSRAFTGLERLLTERRDTLLVRLLSDGRGAWPGKSESSGENGEDGNGGDDGDEAGGR